MADRDGNTLGDSEINRVDISCCILQAIGIIASSGIAKAFQSSIYVGQNKSLYRCKTYVHIRKVIYIFSAVSVKQKQMDLMIIRHIHGLARCVASLGKGAVSLLLLLSVSFLPALWQEHCRSVSIWKWTEVRTTYTFHPP